MHTRHDTAQVIPGKGAGCVMTVKVATMPALHKQLKKLPRAAVPAVPAVSTGHARPARRTTKAVLAPAWIGFEGATQAAQTRRKKGNKTAGVAYPTASDRDADPTTLAARARSYREIENRLHRVRDVTYQEDKSLVRTGDARRVMASSRSLAISLPRPDGHASIAAANRHHARDPQRTLNCSGCMNATLPCP